MRRQKKVAVASGDGWSEVTIEPGITTERLKRLLALPRDVDIASDRQGRVLLPDEDLFEVLDENDVLRAEPAAYLGSLWSDLLVLLCVSALVLPRVLALYHALCRVARASENEKKKAATPFLMPPSSTAVLVKEDRCCIPPLQREAGARSR